MITAYIRGQKLLLDPPELASDSRNFLEAEFCFTGRDWDGYAKTAYFTSGDKALAIALIDDRISPDMGLNLTAGDWELKLSGVKGDSRITTTRARFSVQPFGATEGEPPDVSLTHAEQLQAQIGTLSALKTSAKGSLVEAINEVAQTGGSGGDSGAGLRWRGEYDDFTTYAKGDAVSSNGSSFIFVSEIDVEGAIPGIDPEWELLASCGADYRLTASDKSEITQAVLSAMPSWKGGAY